MTVNTINPPVEGQIALRNLQNKEGYQLHEERRKTVD